MKYLFMSGQLLLTLIPGLSLPFTGHAALEDAAPTVNVRHTTATYESGQHTIRIECYRPVVSNRMPAVILVHGADGLKSEVWNDRYRQYAGKLAGQGYAVFFPHYFERTGGGKADFSTILHNFAIWRESLSDATDFAAKQPGVDPSRIGLVGISLGSSLAVSLASEDERIRAVVSLFGVFPALGVGMMNRLPPTLILHGAKDQLVPVQEAYRIERQLKALHTPYEIKVYPDQGHGFTGAAVEDSYQRTVNFLEKYLNPSGHPLNPGGQMQSF
jgi:dipeptidyl aminopeptidase/acylaminoacyl peptidase